MQEASAVPPAFIAGSTATGSSASTTVTVPAGTLTGHVMDAVAVVDSGTVTTPSGWTKVFGPITSSFNNSYWFTRTADAADAAGAPTNTKTYAFAHTASTFRVVLITTSNIIETPDASASGAGGTSTTHITPTVTTTQAGDWVMRAVSADANTVTYTWPTSTELFDSGGTSGISVAALIQSAAGAAGTETATSSGSTGNGSVGMTVAHKHS